MKIYDHWSHYPMDKWRWESFSPAELASRGEGELAIHEPTMDKLQALRDLIGRPIIITSAYRSEVHNKAVGGAKGSYHKKAQAFDIRMDNQDPIEFEKAAEAVGFTGFGGYPRQGFMHIDTGPARRWGKWWEKRLASGNLPAEAKAPTPLSKDNGMRSVAMAGIGIGTERAGVFLSGLHPDAQMFALAIGGVCLVIAIALGWKKIKEILS